MAGSNELTMEEWLKESVLSLNRRLAAVEYAVYGIVSTAEPKEPLLEELQRIRKQIRIEGNTQAEKEITEIFDTLIKLVESRVSDQQGG